MEDDPSFIVLDKEEFDRKMENGVYPYTMTSSDRYTNPASFDYRIYSELSHILEDRSGEYTLLDIASSSGEPLRETANRLEEETGTELRPVALDVKKKMMEKCYEEGNAEPVTGLGQELPFRDNSIDLVVSSQLNLKDNFMEEVVDEIDRVMKPEGYAVLSTGYVLEEDNYQGVHHGEITPR